MRGAAAKAMIAANPGDALIWARVALDVRQERTNVDFPPCACCDGEFPYREFYDREAYRERGRGVFGHRVTFETEQFGPDSALICDECLDSWEALITDEAIPERAPHSAPAVSSVETAVRNLGAA